MGTDQEVEAQKTPWDEQTTYIKFLQLTPDNQAIVVERIETLLEFQSAD
ncbi:MAG: hypothetical protein LUG13_03205 [Oscillospiraceae bacterium]|nr:hypothetical protein [Oscillospiraceae bacterium]